MKTLSLSESHSEIAQDIGAIVECELNENKSYDLHCSDHNEEKIFHVQKVVHEKQKLNALHDKTESYPFSDISGLSNCEPADPQNTPHLMLNEGNILQQNGYQRIRKLCDTQQGELIEAITIESEGKIDKNVIIKKVSRKLHIERSTDAKYTGDGMNYCIPKNVIKEALILRHLTVDNHMPSICNYIVQFLHFFHCDKFYYVVLEHVDHNTMNLKEFVEKSHRFIRDGKLNMKQYTKVIKFIFWQIFVLIQWMHNDMNCCHLDLKLEHILLRDVYFITDTKSGKISINPKISIKVFDFGSAELFRDSNFECGKEVSPLCEIQYKSPQIFNEEIYDAQKADIWALGMMLVHCVIGRPLYKNVYDAGFVSLQRGTIERYLKICGLKRYLKKRTLDLVKNMLKMDENKRYSIRDALKHKLFQQYYSKYVVRIEAQSRLQKAKLIEEKNKLKHFPFYQRDSRKFGFV